MKKLIALFTLSLLILNPILAQVDGDTLTPTVETTSISVFELDFEFSNNKDSLTLEVLETGTLKFTWKNIKSGDSHVGIRIKSKDSTDWISAVAEIGAGELSINDVPENQIWNYQIGTGSNPNSIEYATEIKVCHSISGTIFENNSAKGKEEAGQISWAIAPNKLKEILEVYPDATYSLKWNTKIGAKRNKADPAKSPWGHKDKLDINTVSHKVKDLIGGDKYVYKVGINLGDKTIWSEKGKFETERAWGLFRLLVLIGALGLFIFGMKIMSEGLQKAAGSKLRNMLGSITSNRVKGVITGFGITSIVQSSSVTTVMTVSFVNAGLMTLRQSAGVMMGANIGTTITAWLILIFGFKVSIGSYALIFIAIGAPLLFFAKEKARAWSSAIIGFALLFMGLGALKDSVPDLGPESAIVQFFIDFKDVWYGPLMFVILGALVTVVIQSSSAAMALTMTMVAGGVIPFEVASAMILGENIGTTITAELASLIGNVHAKRSARIHSLFNIIGVTWAILMFPFILKGLAFLIEGDPYTDGNAANLGLALFHSSFNLLNVLILIGFVPWLVRMAEKTVKSRGAKDEEFHLDYITTSMMGTPNLSILEAQKEVAKFGEITGRMSGFTRKLLTTQNKKEKNKLHEKISKYEDITDRVEIEVANYLAKLSEGEMSEETAKRVRSMNSIVNDLERIGDIFYQMSKAIERKDEQKLYFLPEQRAKLNEMFDLIDHAFEVMATNLSSSWSAVTIDEAKAAETKINKMRNQMRKEYLGDLQKKEFNMESGMVYNNLFSSCEKVGDHIINVTEAILGIIN
ncbi:MAG: Na/Pi cotransporter family protein [Crocinitomicaceae bacterium]|nr:Na/Pi cotransporter family protein [Crocinitomicaceae bacterium]